MSLSTKYIWESDPYTVSDCMTVSTPALSISDDSILKFEDGTQISGKTLRKYFKVLQHIIETDYPEELI